MNNTELTRAGIKIFFALLVILLLSGCIAGQSSFVKGKQALQQENYDQAVMDLLEAVHKNPDNHQYRLQLVAARNQAAIHHKTNGDELFALQRYRDAVQEYQLALELDGSLYAAAEGVNLAQRYLQAQTLVEEAALLEQTNRIGPAETTLGKALDLIPDYEPALQLRRTLKERHFTLIDGVALEVTSSEPITLNFNETSLPDVFDILTKLTGINFILDEDVRGEITTLYLEKATFAQALELLLRMNKLDKKILNSKTIILFPKTRDKQKQFEDQILQTFYLTHIDAKKAVNLLRTMLQVRKIYVHDELNAIVMRDHPDVIKLAQKLLEANDRGNSEVVFDLELIEVNHSDTRELGLKLSNYSIGAGLSAAGTGTIVSSGLSAGGVTTGLIDSFKGLDPFYAIPTATFRFAKGLVSAEILANPKIRVRNREKAKVHVGSREPVITATSSDSIVTENVSYIDVGVKLNVEPLVQLDNTIVTRIGLEVSNVSGRQTTKSGTVAITVSSTSADTTLTLKDGEQTVIGGLIRDDQSTTKTKIPLFGDVPLLGEVFNSTDKTKSKREILLSITPHIVKSVNVPQGDVASIWSGGEDELKFGRNFGTFIDEYSAGQRVMQPAVKPASDHLGGDLNRPLVNEQIKEDPSSRTEQDVRHIGTAPPPTGADIAQQPSLDLLQEEIVAAEMAATEQLPAVLVAGADRGRVGTELEIAIGVEGVSNLFSSPLAVQYDPVLLELVDVREGEFLHQGGMTTIFTSDQLKEQGKVLISLKQGPDAQPASGGGNLVYLTFIPLQAGSASITPTQVNLRNGRNEAIKVNVYDSLIEIDAVE